ncbi:hypothetical protein EWM64_g7559 [Hericium alpestre]|uniref:Uncharacterized protein n=1 Tax=Hericium alpestre TaxID=135208 RepID=A0A4Y9ZQC0_9AGAM|nr:hypothetical protein EWM64_g7559 [Hericium alpestre]
MKSAFIALVSVALAAGAYAQSLTINTPVLPGADPSGAALEDFGQQNTSPFTWDHVNFPQGTSLGLTLRDSQGNTAQSAPFTINPGSDTSCLTASSSGASSGTASATSPASSSASSASASSTSEASTSAASSSASASSASVSATSHASSVSASSASSASRASTSSSTSASASPTAGGGTADNGAVAKAASFGAIGVVGAIVAAVLA